MSSPAVPPADRFARLDALRGAAMLWMAGFHFSFDLNYYRLIHPPQNFYSDSFWTLQRMCIVSLFLCCAGLGQAIAAEAGQGWPRFWRRWAQVAACALLVSAGSWLMFPTSWISFGVLHGMAVMLLLARLAPRRLGPLALLAVVGLGAWALVLPRIVHHPFFDSRATNWVGLVTHLPVTEDYVPVLPWLGVLLWGLAAGAWVLRHRRPWLAGALPAALRPLAALGRWPLTFYMLHQPVLIGGILVALQLSRHAAQ